MWQSLDDLSNTAWSDDRDFVSSNNCQGIFEKTKHLSFYKRPQGFKEANRHKGINSKKDYSLVSPQRESIEFAEIGIQSNYNPVFFFAEQDDLFIAGFLQSCIRSLNNIITTLTQEVYAAGEEAMVSKQPHLTNLLDRNPFVFKNTGGIMNAGFNVFSGDIRITLFDNCFSAQSLFNKLQNHINRYPGSFNARLAKANVRVDTNPFLIHNSSTPFFIKEPCSKLFSRRKTSIPAFNLTPTHFLVGELVNFSTSWLISRYF